MIVQEPTQAAIWHCLNHYAYSDAVFLAERLYAEVKSDESLYLLATSYYRNGSKHHAYAVLKNHNGHSPQCRYLYAKCAMELEKFVEAEDALSGFEGLSSNKNIEDIITDFGDQACFALQLLANICLKTERKVKAVEVFKRALKLNPFLWTCFVELCNMGEKPEASQTFQISNMENLSTCHGTPGLDSLPVISNSNNNSANLNIMETPNFNTPTPTAPSVLQSYEKINSKLCTPDENPIGTPICLSGIGTLHPQRMKQGKHRGIWGPSSISPLTPSFGVLQCGQLDFGSPTFQQSTLTLTEANDQKSLAKRVKAHVGQLINRKEAPLQNSKPLLSQSSNVTNNITTPSSPASLTSIATQNVRRSTRLFCNSYSVKENNKSPNRNKFVTPKSPSRKTNKRIAKTNNLNENSYTELNARNKSDKERTETITSEKITNNNTNSINNSYNALQQSVLIQKQCAEGLMQLMRTLGQAYYHLSQFECKKAIDCLMSVAPHQFNTAWVQGMLGKSYFELVDYEQAVEYFSAIHKKEPFRLEYMDMYSTALWHLQREVALSALAQDLIKLDKNSPISWCVTGNCFSLHKEHDTAIKFLQRAVQVDPNYPYAHTLLGHEFIVTEELDKAMTSFRNAIRLDYRHYNAWFGIGTICSKQERYQLAEYYYSRAQEINKYNSVILCHIGVVQYALKKVEKSLQTLNQSIANDRKNPLCKFHRAQTFFNLGRYAESLLELEELKEIAPKESSIHYLIGRVHKILGNTDQALMHFSWATDLDPKGASSNIKEVFDMGQGPLDYGSPQTQSNNEEFQSQSVVPATETSLTSYHSLLEVEDSDDSL